MTFELIVAGEPVPKARPRVTRTGHAYTPQKTKDAEARIVLAWRKKFKTAKTIAPIKVEVSFYLKRPKGRVPEIPQKRPDVDNLAKTVLDALNGVAYEDDKQVFWLESKKYWAEKEPYTEIIISEV